MKYVVILGDGMSDYPIEEFGNKTPLQHANKPVVDELAKNGVMGLAVTVPDNMPPGSDTANLSVMGYDPHRFYSGRSPFEAASMGINLLDTDITFRCNLVTLSDGATYDERVMVDHSADEISSKEGAELISAVNEHFNTADITFYPGVSYRHLMVWSRGPYEWDLIPPHDILGQVVGGHLPAGKGAGIIEQMMRTSCEFLENHPVNIKRKERGLSPANAIWIWGEGKKPQLSSFYEKYGLTGSVISAVDLIKGIGLCAGLEVIEVEGATGNINTNFSGKAQAALKALAEGQDFVYVHLEAPDEASHRQEGDNKVKSIELIDEHVIKVIKEGLDGRYDYKIMFLPDHATPLSLRTHTRDPVPFLIYDSVNQQEKGSKPFDEENSRATGFFIREGYRLMDYFLKGTLKAGGENA